MTASNDYEAKKEDTFYDPINRVLEYRELYNIINSNDIIIRNVEQMCINCSSIVKQQLAPFDHHETP